jgi:transposase
MKSKKTAQLKERELIIKLSNEGKTCREIASLLGIGKSTASYWIVRYNKTNDLKDKPRSGRPTLLTKMRLTEISEKIKLGLRGQKDKVGISSKEVIEILVEVTGRKYTIRHARRLLHKMGFSLITPRVSHIKKNKETQNRFREEFKKSFKKTMWGIQL